VLTVKEPDVGKDAHSNRGALGECLNWFVLQVELLKAVLSVEEPGGGTTGRTRCIIMRSKVSCKFSWF
jgi:hypothetical protein